MADRHSKPSPITRQTRPGSAPGPTFLRLLHDRTPNSTQVAGFLTFLVSGGILLMLTGFTVTAAVTALVLFAPILLISSPLWVPAAAVMFVVATGFFSACGVGVAVLAGATWMYRYFTGRQPVGSGRVDYARGRIADTAKEYAVYLPGRVKDAAPGA